ncbi:hypothetical protein M422DRAFT_195330, partial [Sphaerobolus stellatus SS14]
MAIQIVIPKITVAEGAAILNVGTTFIQYTLGLSLVAILLYILPSVNTANTWTIVAREIQGSLWATLLRSQSTTADRASLRVRIYSKASFISTALIALSAAIAPLGLKEGPILTSPPVIEVASYLPDTSPMGLATPPRGDYRYSRSCGSDGLTPCPGSPNDEISLVISPKIIQKFNSTPYGPFSMQFRRYITSNVGDINILYGSLGIVDSLILRDGMFVMDGLVVDLGDSPGIGFLNHTIPNDISHGATWSQDILWVEPQTACVNTNLTVDYAINGLGIVQPSYNMTDRGGFANPPIQYPPYGQEGQDLNLYEHAYKATVLSNNGTLRALNTSRSATFVGNTFQLNASIVALGSAELGKVATLPLTYLSLDTDLLVNETLLCANFGGGDTASIATPSMQCGIFMGPPRRSDGSDPRILLDDSTWTQTLHGCASTMRASIQRVQFSINGTRELGDVQVISRQPIERPVLWGVEQTDLIISNISLFWGVVEDQYENDPTLATIRH